MRRLAQIIGRATEGGRGRRRDAGGHRPRLGCEALEGRSLLTIAGVSLVYGNLQILAPKASGNVVQVSIDSANHDIKVTLNGQSEEFVARQVSSVSYRGGSGGGDTFVNHTSLVELAYGFGGNNKFTGGTGYNYIHLYGNNNTYTAQVGSFSDVWEDGGTGDVINRPAGATIQRYS